YNYHNNNSDVYASFIDIRKAFDSVDHDILMNKLLESGIPGPFVSTVRHWYNNQYVNVKYANHTSDEWLITNGVRQGGVLSGLFFNLYINSLIVKINDCSYGCKLGIFKSNIIAYADDIVLLAPSSSGLQILINKAVEESKDIKLNFNNSKSKWMLFNSPKSKSNEVSDMIIDNEPIEKVNSFKYLGYVIRSDLSNIDDIQRALRKFYSDFNGMLRKFSFASLEVKLYLFKYFCLQMYGADLWIGNRGSLGILNQFAIGYHKAIKKMLG
ncbi:MAG: reverse transcriptase family protein, partial [Bacteroidota bacterium]